MKRLRDYGLKSERLLWPSKGPSVFERELGAEELESKLSRSVASGRITRPLS